MSKSSLGLLLPNEEELNIYRTNLTEASNRLGRNGLFYPVTNNKHIGTDTFYEYGSPTNISYFLVENPKKTLLNKYGWNVEYEKKPIICWFSFLDSEYNSIFPTEGCIIELSTRINPHGELGKDTRKFQVVEAQSDLDMNMFIAKLAPYREVQRPDSSYHSPNDPVNENMFFNRSNIV